MADPGVRLRAPDPVTGQLRSTVTPRTLTVRLTLHTPKHKKMRRHLLLLNADNEPHPLLVQTHEVTLDKDTDIEQIVQTHPKPATAVVVRWFADVYASADEMWAQEGIGCTTVSHDGTYTLLDTDNEHVGTLRVSGYGPPTQPVDTPVNQRAQKLVSLVEKAYMRLPAGERVPEDIMVDMGVYLTRVTRLPLLWYAVHAAEMRAVPARATQYFQNALSISKFLAPSDECPERLLADMIALPSLGWIYRPDLSQRGDPNDVWASLWTYPGGGGFTAFDCEDGTKALLELFEVFCRIMLTAHASAELVRLQALARTYRPWITIGQLLSEGKYVLHCYLTLMPINRKAPVITVESTMFQSCVWKPGDRDATLVARDTAERAVATCFVDRLNRPALSEVMHIRTPSRLVRSKRTYGQLVSMFTARDEADRAVHKLMRGVPAETFFTNPSVVEPLTVFDMPSDDARDIFVEELRLAPGSRFPFPPPTPFIAPRMPANTRYVVLPTGTAAGVDAPVTQQLRLCLLPYTLSH